MFPPNHIHHLASVHIQQLARIPSLLLPYDQNDDVELNHVTSVHEHCWNQTWKVEFGIWRCFFFSGCHIWGSNKTSPTLLATILPWFSLGLISSRGGILWGELGVPLDSHDVGGEVGCGCHFLDISATSHKKWTLPWFQWQTHRFWYGFSSWGLNEPIWTKFAQIGGLPRKCTWNMNESTS